ncbi:MAG: hypothetical protein JSS22_08815 [Proteobacteria bacterium]|nr:hypothetical protein [Pseudomonadota bacterium]
MRLVMGWAASLAAMVVASAAQAQVLAPTEIGQPAVVVSDVDGPYAAMPPEAPPFVDGPRLLPPTEVYTVVRESGFSPLGVPRQRGFVYTIAVINRDGDDGRLVIDARNGRIVRFMPAYLAGDRFNEGTAVYSPVGPPPAVIEGRRGIPRPPARIPRLAMRTPSVPLPKAAPHAVVAPKHVAAKPKPAAPPVQQSAAVETRPAETKPAAAPAPAAAKPSATIEPTQTMPPVQGLD